MGLDLATIGYKVESAGLDAADRKLKKLGETADSTEKKLSRIGSTSKTASGGLSSMGGDVDRLDTKTKKLSQTFTSLKGTLNGVGDKLRGIGASLTAKFTTPILASGTAVTLVARQWENATVDIAKQLPDGVGENAYKAVLTDIKDLAEKSGKTRESLAELTAEAGKAGVEFKNWSDFMRLGTEGAVALDMQAGELAQTLLGIGAGFGIRNNMEALKELTQQVNVLADSSKSTGAEIFNTTSRVAGLAKEAGLSEIQVAALAATLIDTGKAPEIASTSIRALLTQFSSLKNLTPKATQAIEDLGLAPDALIKKFREDAPAALEEFKKAVDKSGDTVGSLTQIFGRENSAGIAALLGNLDKYGELLEKTGDKALVATKWQQELTRQQATFDSKLGQVRESLKNLVDVNMLDTLKDLLDSVKPIIQSFGEWMRVNPELTKYIAILAGGLAALGPTLLGLGSAIPIVTTAFSALTAVIIANPIGAIIAAIAVGATLIYKNWDKLVSWWNNTTFAEKIISINDTAILGAKMVATEFAGWWNQSSLREWAVSVSPAGVEYAEEKARQFMSWWNSSTLAEKVLGLVTAPLQIGWNLAKDAFAWWNTLKLSEKVLTLIPKPLKLAWELAKKFKAWWDNLSLKVLIPKIEMPDFSGIINKAKSLGRNISEGIGKGISAGAARAKQAAKSMSKSVFSSVKGFFGIKSPSRLMADLAKWIPEGIAVGINANQKAPVFALSSLNKKLSSTLMDSSKSYKITSKAQKELIETRKKALKTIADEIAEEKRGFPIIKGLTLLESKREFLRKKAVETKREAVRIAKSIYDEATKRTKQITALTGLNKLNSDSIASVNLQLDHYTKKQAEAKIADDKRIAGLKKIAEINDNLQIQTVRLEQGDEAARLLELSKQYGAEQAKIIQQKEQQLRYTDQEIAAWDTVKNAIADVFNTGELKWNNLRDALLKPLTLDVNLKINKAAGDIQKSIQSVFSKGGGFGDLIKTVRDSVGGLFKGTGKGIGGAINSYQIGSGLASALGANPAGQMGAGIGAALGSFMPGIGSTIGSVVGGLIGNLFSHNPKIRFNQSFEKGQTAENWNDGRNYEGKSVFGRFGLDRASKRFYKLSDAAKDATEKMMRVAEIADGKIAKLMTSEQIEGAKTRLSNQGLKYGNNSKDIKSFLLERLRIQLEQLSPAIQNVIKSTGDYEHQLQALSDIVDIKETVLPIFDEMGAEIGKSAQTILTEFKNNDFLSAWVEQFPEDALAEAERQAQDARLVIVYKWGEKLKQEGESVSQALIRSAGNFAAVTTMADNMGISSSTASLKGLELSNQLIELAGGLNEFGSKAEFVYQNFFTQAERDIKTRENASNAIAAYNEQFSGLDITSRDTFRTIIDSIDLTTEAGVKQYAALLDVAQAVDTLYPKLEETAGSVTDLSSAISLFNQEFYSSAEQAAQKLADAQATLANSNLDLGGMDNIREKFRTLIESLDPGSDAYNNAIQYAQAIDIIADAQEDAARKLAEATQNYESYFLGTNHSLEEARAVVASLGLSVDNLKNSYIALVNGATGAERERLISLNDSVRIVIEEENRLKEARIRAAEEAAREQARQAEKLAREQQRIYEEHQRALKKVADLTRELADLQAQLAELDRRIAGGGTSAEDAIQAQIDAQQIVVQQARDSVTAAQNAYNEAMRYWEAQQQAAQAGREYLESLKLDNNLTNLTPQEQLAEAQRQYQAALASGDVGATQSAMQKYLQLARSAYGSSDQYDQILNLTRGSFEDLLASIENQPQPSDDILNTARANLQAAEDQLAVLREQLELARETARTEDLEAQRADLAAKIQAKMDELALAKEASNATITPHLATLKNTHETNYANIIQKLAQQITIDSALPADIRDHLNANLTAIRNATDNTTLTAATQTMRDYINSLPVDIRSQLDPRLTNLVGIKTNTGVINSLPENIRTKLEPNLGGIKTNTSPIDGNNLAMWFKLLGIEMQSNTDVLTLLQIRLDDISWYDGKIRDNIKEQNKNWHKSGSGSAIPSFAKGADFIDVRAHQAERILPAASNKVITQYFMDKNHERESKPVAFIGKNKEQEKTNKLLEASLKKLEEIKSENQQIKQELNELKENRSEIARFEAQQRNDLKDAQEKNTRAVKDTANKPDNKRLELA